MKPLLAAAFGLLLSCAPPVRAQPKPDLSRYANADEKLEAWLRYCDLFLGNQPGYTENYAGMVVAAREGIALCPPDRYKKLGQFHFMAGVGYANTGKADSAILFFKTAEGFSWRARDTLEVVRSLGQLSNIYYSKGKDTLRSAAIQQLKAIASTARGHAVQKEAAGILAEYYANNQQYEDALRYNLQQADLQLRNPNMTRQDSIAAGVSLTRIGEVEILLEHDRNALRYFMQAEPFFKFYKGGSIHIANAQLQAYIGLKSPDSALLCYNKMISRMGNQHDYPEEIVYANLNFSGYFLEEGDVAKAALYSSRAYALAQSSATAYCLMQANYQQGKIALTTHHYQDALRYLLPATEVASGQDKSMEMDLRQMAAEAYHGVGDFRNAYLQQARYAVLRDTIAAEANRRQLAEMTAEMDVKYQSNARQQQIALLNKDNQLKGAALRATRRQQLLAFAGLLLLAGLAATLAISYRNKQRTATLLDQKNTALTQLNHSLDEANQTKARLFGIISHDLRGPVSQLYQYIRLQQEQPGLLSPAQAAAHSQKISTGAASLLDTMEDILIWSKSQLEGFRPVLTPVKMQAMAHSIAQLLQPLAEQQRVTITQAITPAAVLATDGNILHIILRNLVQNALQHAPAGTTVRIDFAMEPAAPRLSISDEGPPLPQDITATLTTTAATPATTGSAAHGLGLQLVKELADKLGIKIAVLQDAVKGKKIVLEFAATGSTSHPALQDRQPTS